VPDLPNSNPPTDLALPVAEFHSARQPPLAKTHRRRD
jgi:hypothetical protein